MATIDPPGSGVSFNPRVPGEFTSRRMELEISRHADTDYWRKDSDVGQCEFSDRALPGQACEVTRLQVNSNGRKDRILSKDSPSCGPALKCLKMARGFPGGLCAGKCDESIPPLPGGTCGSLVKHDVFSQCLQQERPFGECIADDLVDVQLRGCDSLHPCRDDYICAKAKGTGGACIPPYFLFQFRVDGHPSMSDCR